MNSVKVAYIICTTILELSLLALAVAAPIWLTPGYYWWSAFALLMIGGVTVGFTERMNSWGDCGHVETNFKSK